MPQLRLISRHIASRRTRKPAPSTESAGRMRIRKRGLLSGARQKCEARPGEEAEPVLSAMHNFEILADMGVPSDIFDEPGEPVQKCPLVRSLMQKSHFNFTQNR